jgi:hypothetical protein
MKKLSLRDIKSGALIGKPEKVTVQIRLNEEDTEFETFIKPFNYDSAVANMRAYGENKEALAGIIASCLCDENGKLVLTEDEVRSKFNQALVDAVWTKIVEINVLGKTLNSSQMTSSLSKSESQQEEQQVKSVKHLHSKKSKNMPPTSEKMEVSTQVE